MVSVDQETDVLWLWDCGFDTKDISVKCGLTEAEAESVLWRARERRRAEQGEAYECACASY
jgi:hypothetical protein